MRQSWTDDRLDEFGRRIDERFDRVDERFDRVDERFDRVNRDIAELGDRTDKRIAELGERVDSDIRELREDNRVIHAQLGAIQRTMIQVGGGLLAANVALTAAVIGLTITQL